MKLNWVLFVVATTTTAAKKEELSGERGWSDAEATQDHWRKTGHEHLQRALASVKNMRRAKNVILMMGDGMGMASLTTGRILRGQKNGANGESYRTRMERLDTVGLSKTYNIDFQIPDSAATATALLTGVKVKFMTVGVDGGVTFDDCSTLDESAHLESILTRVAKSGKSTGLVTTTRITHATPAAAYGHSVNRWYESSVPLNCLTQTDLAQQLVSSANFNITFGGGERYFTKRSDNQNLIEQWPGCYVNTTDALMNLDLARCDHTLGLFNDNHIDYISQRPPHQPGLKAMTMRALDKLELDNNGYFLFVEAGRIDHGHHDSQAHLALDEFVEFDETIEMVMDRINATETLVIVTADHRLCTCTVVNLGDKKSKIQYGIGKNGDDEKKYNVPNVVLNAHDHVFTSGIQMPKQSNHAGEDVPVFAEGPWAHLLNGVYEQSYINTVMMYALCMGEYENEKHC